MTKTAQLLESLQGGWCSARSLAAGNGWSNNTLRGAISTASKKASLKIERKRENGDTFYRVAPTDYQPRDDFNKSINDCYEAVRERVKEGGPSWEPK